VSLRRQFLAIAANSSLVAKHRFSNGNDNGEYFNFDFDTPSPAALWAQIGESIYDASAAGQMVREASMAICTGHNGWDDYLLIHHWDPAEDLDEVPAT
jgi:hypothetical protein